MSGEWPPGYRLPYEIDLAARYNCSRMTVNKAMTQLSRAGLIERKRKSGSYVSMPQTQAAVLDIHNIETEVQGLKLAYSYQLQRQVRRRATNSDRAWLTSRKTEYVQAITCLHLAGGTPFCIEFRLINESAVGDIAMADFSQTPPGTWLLQQIAWSMAEHRIFACAANSTEAGMLKIKTNAACLVIERKTWNAEMVITHVRFVYPANRHSLVARFKPESSVA